MILSGNDITNHIDVPPRNLHHIPDSPIPAMNSTTSTQEQQLPFEAPSPAPGTPSASEPPHANTATLSLDDRTARENAIKRNPHGDFKAVEAARPYFRHDDKGFSYTKTPQPEWAFGTGGNDAGASLEKKHVEINPYQEGRPVVYNYKLMISSMVPRPIGFLSTCSKDGNSENLAPFSFTNMINSDPPLFTVGFTGCGLDNAKDTLRNLIDTRECVLNQISEHFVEAANSTSIGAPYGVSEWAVSGLHQAECRFVRPKRVREAVFATECTLVELREWESKDPAARGTKTGVLAILEGVNFWAREDAINEERNIIDPAVRAL